MATTLLERLLFAQGNTCFFCQQQLDKADASVEHIVARTNGGGNGEDNCVACCKSLNSIFGSKGLKAKLEIILRQKGEFRCPGRTNVVKPAKAANPARAVNAPKVPGQSKTPPPVDHFRQLVENLRKRGASRPRTAKSLNSMIGAMFQNKLAATEVSALASRLQTEGVVSVSGTKIEYHFA